VQAGYIIGGVMVLVGLAGAVYGLRLRRRGKGPFDR
jgi:hypothetical protein